MAYFVVVLVLLGLLAVCWLGFTSTERQARSEAGPGMPEAPPATKSAPAPTPPPASVVKRPTATPPEGV